MWITNCTQTANLIHNRVDNLLFIHTYPQA